MALYYIKVNTASFYFTKSFECEEFKYTFCGKRDEMKYLLHNVYRSNRQIKAEEKKQLKTSIPAFVLRLKCEFGFNLGQLSLRTVVKHIIFLNTIFLNKRKQTLISQYRKISEYSEQFIKSTEIFLFFFSIK